MSNNRRVVVTGLGVVSSLGIGWEEFWKNLIAGKSGISRIESFDTSSYDRHYGGEIKNFNPFKYFSKRKASLLGRSSQFAIVASRLALQDSKLELTKEVKKRTAVCIGMTMAEMTLLEGFNDKSIFKKKLKEKNVSYLFPANSVSSNVAIEHGLSGHNIAFSTACSAGNYSIGYAYDLIKAGKMDYAFVGGSDSISRVVFTGFSRIFAIAPEKCQPFDKNRKGMIPGEGAGILLLETLESANARNAEIYAEILGYGLSSDAHNMTEPDPVGISKAIFKSLKYSMIEPKGIDYISAHGTGTVENDREESKALKMVFNTKLKDIPVSSIKSMLGHTMGAAAAIEAISCCLAFKFNEVPPTINFEMNDPECELDCVPNIARKKNIKCVLNNSEAFGGNNSAVIFG